MHLWQTTTTCHTEADIIKVLLFLHLHQNSTCLSGKSSSSRKRCTYLGNIFCYLLYLYSLYYWSNGPDVQMSWSNLQSHVWEKILFPCCLLGSMIWNWQKLAYIASENNLTQPILIIKGSNFICYS